MHLRVDRALWRGFHKVAPELPTVLIHTVSEVLDEALDRVVEFGANLRAQLNQVEREDDVTGCLFPYCQELTVFLLLLKKIFDFLVQRPWCFTVPRERG